jgi:hypothetical protein
MPRRDITPKDRTSLASRFKSLQRGSAASAPTQYQYCPLSEGVQEIRLMTLFSGTVSSDIRVSLETVPFTKDDVHDFEALSYAWGSAENLVEIFIGASGQHVLSVTQNLAEALPYLRYEDRSRVFWIDAICVNQQDLEERSRQVERMADIFTKASRVVVWLGPESSDSSVSMDCFHTISENVEVDQVTQSVRSLSNETRWAENNVMLPFSEAEYMSIYRLISRSWFERLWIWQEVRLGSRNTIVKCGAKELPWRSICTGVLCLYIKPKFQGLVGPDLLSCEIRVQALCNRAHQNLFVDLIEQTQMCLCSDPRDKVFAILSLLQPREAERLRIKPSYSKSVQEVYIDTAILHFERFGSVELLQMVEEHSQSQNLPSWVPDFASPRLARPLHGPMMCTGSSQAVMKIVEKQRLQIAGVRVATIEHVEIFGDHRKHYGDFRPEADLERIISAFLGKESYTHDEQHVEAFYRTIYNNNPSESIDPPHPYLPSKKQCEDFLSDALGRGSPGDILSHDQGRYMVWNEILRRLESRSIFKTAEGNFGLAPNAAMVGDAVVILLGCRSAMVFREGQNDTYQVIGEACLDGFMECQALLGPLPNPFDYKLHYNEPDDTWYYVCFNMNTGLVQVEDPRLGPLPEHVRTMPVL